MEPRPNFERIMEDVDQALNEAHRRREEVMEANRRAMHRIETEAAMIQQLTYWETAEDRTDLEICDLMEIPMWALQKLRRMREHHPIQTMNPEQENQWNEIVDNWRGINIDNGQH